MTTVAELPPGFGDKVLSAQATFRSVMDAMARPGSVRGVAAVARAPGEMMRGTAAIALTLFDHDTPVWLDPLMSETPDVTKWLKFHTGAPVTANSSICSFAMIDDARALPALDRFAFGSNEYPDRSTTLILQVESLTQGPRAVPASTAPLCCRPRSSLRTCSNGWTSIGRCFRAASMSCWWPTMPLSRYLALRGWAPREAKACMSRSREANAPSRTRIGCWRMSGGATALFPKFRSPKSLGNLASPSIA